VAFAMSLDEKTDATGRDTPDRDGWATFESKVRGQRFARCIARSRDALDRAQLADAREALNEARTLSPDAPELDEIEGRIASHPSPVAVFLSAEPQASEPDPVWPRVLAGMAAMVVLIGLVGFGLALLRHTVPARQLFSLNQGSAPDEQGAGASTPSSGPSARKSEEGRSAGDAVALATRDASPAQRAPTATTGIGTDAGAAMPETYVSAPRTSWAADPPDEESLRIQSVLLRYENAYNRLEARAGHPVWPGGDQPAPGGAPDQLSQKVSLGLCEITVDGDIGGASCAGKARWEPKVGGGLETVDRHWDFDLRKTAEGWKILEIRVR
jgi:hypothetical protein